MSDDGFLKGDVDIAFCSVEDEAAIGRGAEEGALGSSGGSLTEGDACLGAGVEYTAIGIKGVDGDVELLLSISEHYAECNGMIAKGVVGIM